MNGYTLECAGTGWRALRIPGTFAGSAFVLALLLTATFLSATWWSRQPAADRCETCVRPILQAWALVSVLYFSRGVVGILLTLCAVIQTQPGLHTELIVHLVVLAVLVLLLGYPGWSTPLAIAPAMVVTGLLILACRPEPFALGRGLWPESIPPAGLASLLFWTLPVCFLAGAQGGSHGSTVPARLSCSLLSLGVMLLLASTFVQRAGHGEFHAFLVGIHPTLGPAAAALTWFGMLPAVATCATFNLQLARWPENYLLRGALYVALCLLASALTPIGLVAKVWEWSALVLVCLAGTITGLWFVHRLGDTVVGRPYLSAISVVFGLVAGTRSLWDAQWEPTFGTTFWVGGAWASSVAAIVAMALLAHAVGRRRFA